MHHFFAYINRMKYIRRWGLMRNTLPENDMEHALQAAVIAHALALIGNARYGRNYNAEHIMAMAVYHDACEVITGDMPTPIKHHNPSIRNEYNKLEAVAAQRLLGMLPKDLRADYEPLIAQNEKSPEWRIVKAADRISAYIKCVEERKAGNSEFNEAGDTILASILAIDLPEVQTFMNEFAPGFGMSLDEITRG